MADVNVHAESPYGFAARPTQHTVQTLAGGSMSEIVGGGGAIVLSIVALTGILPEALTSIAVIALGVALALEGLAVAAGYRELLSLYATGEQEAELGGGLTASSLAGLACVALGVLALLGLEVSGLLPIAAIVLGGGVLLGAGVTARLNDLRAARNADPAVQRVAREAIYAATGTEVLVGIAAIVLGIVALQGVMMLTLVAVATLCVGFSIAFAGSAVGSKLAGYLHHA